MATLRLEHVNITVSDVDRAARLMESLFGWSVRWAGPASGGRTIHVGTGDYYVALYAPDIGRRGGPFAKGAPLNHVGVEVDDLDDTEARVIAAGLTPFSHDDYPPGRRFYFFDPDGIEFEVISYSSQAASAD